MTLPTGESPISFSQIRTEFGDGTNTSSSPVRLGQYRRDDSDFTKPPSTSSHHNDPLDTGIPTSGEINVDVFHGKKLNVIVDYHTTAVTGGTRAETAQARYETAPNSPNDGKHDGKWHTIGGYKDRPTDSSGSKVKINVNKTIGSQTVNGGADTICALRTGSWDSGTELTVTVGASGKIFGAGGDGGNSGFKYSSGSSSGVNPEAGENGNSALGITYDGTNVEVADGGIICMGYGGAGGSAGFERGGDGEINGYGGAGGGGAGLPGGEGGLRGGITNTSDGKYEKAGDGTQPAGGEESGAGGTGAVGSEGSTAGHGGYRGFDQELSSRTYAEVHGGNQTYGGGAGQLDPTEAPGTADTPGTELTTQNDCLPGGDYGGNGAAIRRTSGITVNITDANNGITGATNATGVT